MLSGDLVVFSSAIRRIAEGSVTRVRVGRLSSATGFVSDAVDSRALFVIVGLLHSDEAADLVRCMYNSPEDRMLLDRSDKWLWCLSSAGLFAINVKNLEPT